MPIRTVRARVHGKRHIEAAEDLNVADGSELTVTFEVPAAPQPRGHVEFAIRDLGVIGPITRDVIYGDIG